MASRNVQLENVIQLSRKVLGQLTIARLWQLGNTTSASLPPPMSIVGLFASIVVRKTENASFEVQQFIQYHVSSTPTGVQNSFVQICGKRVNVLLRSAVLDKCSICALSPKPYRTVYIRMAHVNSKNVHATGTHANPLPLHWILHYTHQ